MQPSDFLPNGTWLAFRMNRLPVVNKDGEFDIFVLQDAGSMFLFGTAFAAPGAEAPPKKEVTRLFRSAWSHRQEWAQELLLVGNPSTKNAFVRAAREQGLRVRAVAEARMSFYIKDVQSSFEEYAARDGESK
jgi:hypothetical protein